MGINKISILVLLLVFVFSSLETNIYAARELHGLEPTSKLLERTRSSFLKGNSKVAFKDKKSAKPRKPPLDKGTPPLHDD
ncbi:hypothetical protein AQUCO_03000330v1 [Aquilegia coerulea]|uniref:Uncharacterized protein n=1 Tax=Aquilegia coerulea TaxID=218851 RepID=A0A2G5D2H9_AQUCA|nr:hypothetical protein AQUCO_03000330v1 [Aquilegia coerulea]